MKLFYRDVRVIGVLGVLRCRVDWHWSASGSAGCGSQVKTLLERALAPPVHVLVHVLAPAAPAAAQTTLRSTLSRLAPKFIQQRIPAGNAQRIHAASSFSFVGII